jgi:hypothetical protein
MDNPLVLFKGKNQPLSEAIALVMRQMIEEDTLNLPDYNPRWNPYKFWELELGKSEGTIRKWVSDPSSGGATPPLHLFCIIAFKTRSNNALEFIQALVNLDSSINKVNSEIKALRRLQEGLQALIGEIDEICKTTIDENQKSLLTTDTHR